MRKLFQKICLNHTDKQFRAAMIVWIGFGFILITSSCNNGAVTKTESSISRLTATHSGLGRIPANAWKAPDTSTIPAGKAGNMIRYGKELLAHTGSYFGPGGSIARISNGMNCQNCHLDGGSKLFGNNYAAVTATYPRWNDRSSKIQPVTQRIADCFNRSLAGQAPDTNGNEVRAMIAYMKWLGRGAKKGQTLFGTSTEKLAFMDQPADLLKGKAVFITKCKLCHGQNGEGLLAADKRAYTYPRYGANIVIMMARACTALAIWPVL